MLKTRERERREGACYGHHRSFDLDREAERVYCRDCGAEVPAFKALQAVAADPERYIRERQEAARRMKVTSANLADLLRKESNAKARVRGWTGKAPACECETPPRYYGARPPWCSECGGRRVGS